jgi:hypothetical protein
MGKDRSTGILEENPLTRHGGEHTFSECFDCVRVPTKAGTRSPLSMTKGMLLSY